MFLFVDIRLLGSSPAFKNKPRSIKQGGAGSMDGLGRRGRQISFLSLEGLRKWILCSTYSWVAIRVGLGSFS